MLYRRLRFGLPLFAFVVVTSGMAPTADAAETGDESPTSTPAPPPSKLEIASTLNYGSLRQDHVDYAFNTGGASSKRAQSYGGLQLAVRLRATPLLSLGLIASHAECNGCVGERFSRASFEVGLHPIHTRFVDAWGTTDAGFAFSKLAPVQPSLCTNGDVNHCSPLYTDVQTRTRVGPAAGLVDFLPVPYVSIGVETRFIAVPFDAAPGGIDAPSGPTPAVFAGLTLAAHVPLQ